ncbi:MAG: hypothetical protein HN752_04020 [Gammaproteobacteria bacterium]|jgi:hypothetical protein|nr:hypothetical protein [Gammaproteobacteria bacterium]
MSQSFVVPALITATALLITLIFVFMIYLWQRISALEKHKSVELPVETKAGGAALLGFKGKEIWDALENPGKAPVNIDELRQRYSFTLSRHIEQIIDQGQMDKQAGREAVPESNAAIGGLRGEIQSWLPPSYVARFYRIGRDSAVLSDDEIAELRSEVRALVKEILERLGMAAEASGIGSLITSHTLEFHANAADADADTETEEGQEEQAT